MIALPHNDTMQDDDFEPQPVPLCSKALVSVLKVRLYHAILNGKASDAKTFLDIIDRLARLNWLDELDVRERQALNTRQSAQEAEELHAKLYAYVLDQTQK